MHIAAEDRDGFQDQDGCPEEDNDGDGVVDASDKCPNEAEKINGVDDDDGCPDKGESLVHLDADRLELLEPVAFRDSGREVEPDVLGQLATTLRARGGHHSLARRRPCPAEKAPTGFLALSEKRGVGGSRLARRTWRRSEAHFDPKGFRRLKPLIAPNSRKGAAAINDRRRARSILEPSATDAG